MFYNKKEVHFNLRCKPLGDDVNYTKGKNSKKTLSPQLCLPHPPPTPQCLV